MTLIIELTRALAEGPSAIGGGREAEEERLWAAAKLIFIFIFLRGVCSSACPPQGETKGPCHTQTARAVWFWVALMGADSMRSLLDGGRCFSSGAASFWWHFVFGHVTLHPSGRSACCQMVASEVSKAEQTCWWRGEWYHPPLGGTWEGRDFVVSSRGTNGAEVGANWTFWGEVGQKNISQKNNIR